MLMISSPVMATMITILNPGFEEFNVPIPPGWAYEAPHWDLTGEACTWKPGTDKFPGGVPEGVNVVAIGNNADGGVVSQTLTATLEADTNYTLMVDVGCRLDYPMSSYKIEFITGGVTLATDSSLSPAPGTFLTDTIVFNSGSNPAQLGQNLAIQMSAAINGQVAFDNVRLDANAAPVPVPTTMLLFGTGIAGLAGTRLRRKKK